MDRAITANRFVHSILPMSSDSWLKPAIRISKSVTVISASPYVATPRKIIMFTSRKVIAIPPEA